MRPPEVRQSVFFFHISGTILHKWLCLEIKESLRKQSAEIDSDYGWQGTSSMVAIWHKCDTRRRFGKYIGTELCFFNWKLKSDTLVDRKTPPEPPFNKLKLNMLHFYGGWFGCYEMQTVLVTHVWTFTRRSKNSDCSFRVFLCGTYWSDRIHSALVQRLSSAHWLSCLLTLLQHQWAPLSVRPALTIEPCEF